MGKQKSRRWLALPATLLLMVLCLLVIFGIGYSVLRSQTVQNRPLVLIHNPLNRQQVSQGEIINIHASARAENGLQRIELWMDDLLMTEQSVPVDQTTTSMVLSFGWSAHGLGAHQIVVRAYAIDGMRGQSTIAVDVLALDEAGVHLEHIVQEGETLEDIAAGYGIAPEELADANPDLGPDGPAPGDSLDLPSGEESPAGDGESAPDPGDEPAPEPEVPAPGSTTEVLELLGLNFGPFLEALNHPVGLRFEVLSLETGSEYESLHCYIGIGEGTPRWYPDSDGDQATDESFASLGGGAWEVAAHFSGLAAPVATWPGDQPFPASISCVGIAGGGTDAIELGQFALSAFRSDWDGVSRTVTSSGGEGIFTAEYRISRVDEIPESEPRWLDIRMTPPTNARLDDRRISMRWDYLPSEEEEPIDGFRVYLNGNLQWVEPPDARESSLPYEWFNPPCGMQYVFSVTAFRDGFPDGPESFPALEFSETPIEDCNREVQITFISLETFDLGGDGRYEDRTGDVGPVYATFFANDRQFSFDTRSPGSGGSLDVPLGLSHNTLYYFDDMFSDRSSWHLSGIPILIADVPPGGTFEFGFHIMDQDTGRCNDSDDPGCDDLICEGLSMIYEDNTYGELDRIHEGALTSEDGRCRVSFVFGPAFDSPVGTGIEGDEPLPWIEVEKVMVNEGTGQVLIDIRNTGTATWPWRDLEIDLQTRDGSSLGLATWTDFVLEPGERRTLGHTVQVGPPYDACVVIDPNDLVLEAYERSGALLHNPVCLPLPDLTITNVEYDTSGGGRVRVTVQNIGRYALDKRTLEIHSFAPDGARLYVDTMWPEISLEPGEARTFDLIGVNESTRGRLSGGYYVTVNPEGAFPETDMSNNTYTVNTGQLKIWWCDSFVPHYSGLGSTARLFLTVDILTGSGSRQAWSLTRTDTLTSTETFSYGYNHYWDSGNLGGYFSCSESSEIFPIMGDEWLWVHVSGDFLAGSAGSRDPLGSATEMFGPSSNWGSVLIEPSSGHWGEYLDDEDLNHPRSNYCHAYLVDPLFGLALPQWTTVVCIGRYEP